tara:strand:- start:528 stop:794 length:267 start_codon:yes stop_codon:yes gene_type:complete
MAKISFSIPLEFIRRPDGRLQYGPTYGIRNLYGRKGMPVKKLAKSEEWNLCLNAGKKIGLSSQDWMKFHSDKGWSWITRNPLESSRKG